MSASKTQVYCSACKSSAISPVYEPGNHVPSYYHCLDCNARVVKPRLSGKISKTQVPPAVFFAPYSPRGDSIEFAVELNCEGCGEFLQCDWELWKKQGGALCQHCHTMNRRIACEHCKSNRIHYNGPNKAIGTCVDCGRAVKRNPTIQRVGMEIAIEHARIHLTEKSFNVVPIGLSNTVREALLCGAYTGGVQPSTKNVSTNATRPEPVIKTRGEVPKVIVEGDEVVVPLFEEQPLVIGNAVSPARSSESVVVHTDTSTEYGWKMPTVFSKIANLFKKDERKPMSPNQMPIMSLDARKLELHHNQIAHVMERVSKGVMGTGVMATAFMIGKDHPQSVYEIVLYGIMGAGATYAACSFTSAGGLYMVSRMRLGLNALPGGAAVAKAAKVAVPAVALAVLYKTGMLQSGVAWLNGVMAR